VESGDYGQKIVHNDACFPALLVIASSSTAVKTPAKYDPTRSPWSSPDGGGAGPSSHHMLARRWRRPIGLVPRYLGDDICQAGEKPGFSSHPAFIRKHLYAVFTAIF
jgi:hypothetical protein